MAGTGSNFMSFHILACGSNGLYQLGLGNDKDHDSLQHVPGLEQMGHVQPRLMAFGGNHTFVLYPEGQLFAAGSNEFGQCGVNSPLVLKVFTRVPGQWKRVAAGWEFSVLWSHDNQLYSCGSGPKGELGLGEGCVLARSLQKVPLPENSKVHDFKCSIGHTVVELKDGSYVGWGAARKGQLGPQPPVVAASGKSKPRPAVWLPEHLQLEHSDSFCMGRDRTITVGPGIKVHGAEAQEIGVQTHTVKAMWSSLHYLEDGRGAENRDVGSESGGVRKQDSGRDGDTGLLEGNSGIPGVSIRSVGNDLHGQCFRYEAPCPIVAFEVGSEHGLVLLSDNSVHAWGWGEHGNCGAMKDDDVVFNYLNQIYDGKDQVVMMAGGLATTWLVVRRA
ncbi:RCC1/BLIP-II protein [Metschnikowia bicuspidata var. bicuspidata NRRL YB-4993]|uniref:RCC1/BLIP-II protein n=1 Tax=Metschnikowia bicuspidata var. bicuspidata NRRL YB-4993 TaxID=869754 RepID=A0A1A0HD94_9ASCO|nr:RCC1/BLIP-II protein [Metschnikowia bicuspidata var. bicuspidata NRRL YB-4993]OBA21986.1 RCC1/BLIP-II protein [Metschnikowia bicuspidata var. bicuspidata NRRL YB-4993]